MNSAENPLDSVSGLLGVRHCHQRALRLVLALICAFGASFFRTSAQTDNFDDGDDDGWTHYSPLTAVGAAAKFSFPGGAYRIEAPKPSITVFGPARAGSLRTNVTYMKFRVAVDVVNWKQDTRQSFGLVSRITNLGLGATRGYTYNYNPQSGYHQLTLIANEQPAATPVAEAPFPLTPGAAYRLVFTGTSNVLVGQVFAVTNLAVPLHSIYNTDESTYASGNAGLFVFDLTGSGPADATFDNYTAEDPGTVRATVSKVSPLPNLDTNDVAAITAEILNLDTSVNPSSVQLFVDGAKVAADVQTDPERTVVVYVPATPLPAGSHQVKLIFEDALGAQTMEWSFGPPAPPASPLRLESAEQITGPFAPDNQAVIDTGSKTATVPRSGDARFYRLSDTPGPRITSIRITAIRLVDGNVVLEYRFDPI